jgi:mannose-1-phosphate guanylyltransferase/mannose-6-phosphate isomerase
MEKEKNIVVVPFLSKWSDLGDWEAVWREIEPNDKGVSISMNS